MDQENLPDIEAYSRIVLKTDDIHFWTYEKSCFPCDLNYNAIVKTDNIKEMSRFFTESSYTSDLVKQLFAKSTSTVNNQSGKQKREDETRNWKFYFKNLSSETWMKLLQHYRRDFILFDYHLFYCD